MKKSVAITSAVILVASGALALGGVYALFQDKTELSYHIQTGSLNVTPWLTKRYVKNYENPEGKETALDPAIDLSKVSDALFTLGGDTTPIYPGLKEGSEIEVKPAEGAISVDWSLSCSITSIKGYQKNDDGAWVEADNSPVLSQIQVTIVDAKMDELGNNASFKLDSLESKSLALGSFKANTAVDTFFTISYEFLNLDNAINNQAQNCKFSFDFVIDAVQTPLA
jgi:hypothetical protein